MGPVTRVFAFITTIGAVVALAWWYYDSRGGEPMRQQRSGTASVGRSSVGLPDEGLGSRDSEVRSRPGEPLTVELVEDAATHYGRRNITEADRKYASLVRDIGELGYDPALGHAAREVAAFYALERQMAPSGALQFMLNAGGAAEWDVRRAMISTGRTGDEAIVRRVNELWREHGTPGVPLRVGVGEAYTIENPPRRYISILLSGGQLDLEPLPRTLAAGDVVTLAGRLPAGARDPEILLMGPDASVLELKVRGDGRLFEADVPAGDLPGSIQVEIVATLPGGPKPLAQLDLHVAQPLPNRWEGAWAPDESGLALGDTATYLEGLIDDDRAVFDLPRLVRDAKLDAIAERHARDMRDHRFVAHVSPRSGTVGDRLRAGEYKAVAHGENIAKNSSLWDAQAGLLHSLGHRKNILSREFTHVGLGVAALDEGDRRVFYVAQVFARPAPVIDADAATAQLLGRLNDARRSSGLSPLRPDSRLSQVANAQARRPEPTPRDVLDAASQGELISRGAAASVSTLAELLQFTVPERAMRKDYNRVGIGVYQDRSREGADIVVVVLVGG